MCLLWAAYGVLLSESLSGLDWLMHLQPTSDELEHILPGTITESCVNPQGYTSGNNDEGVRERGEKMEKKKMVRLGR